MLSWRDTLASTPVVGIRLNGLLLSGHSILEKFSPVFSKFYDGETPNFSVEAIDAFGFIATTNEGFQYTVNASNLAISYVRRVKLVNTYSDTPSLEIMSLSLSYSELLELITKKILEAVQIVANYAPRSFDRVGIVANTVTGEETFPPGITELISRFKDVWSGSVHAYDFQCTSEIDTKLHWSDQCIHRVTKIMKDDIITSSSIDWQRIYKNPKLLSATVVESEMRACVNSASRYFDQIGDGSAFDAVSSNAG